MWLWQFHGLVVPKLFYILILEREVYTPNLLALYVSSTVKTQIFIPGTGHSTED